MMYQAFIDMNEQEKAQTHEWNEAWQRVTESEIAEFLDKERKKRRYRVPTYTFVCTVCEKETDRRTSHIDIGETHPVEKCESCGGQLKRIMHKATNVSFEGLPTGKFHK